MPNLDKTALEMFTNYLVLHNAMAPLVQPVGQKIIRDLLAEGVTPEQIALELKISVRNVKRAASGGYFLSAQNTLDLIKFAGGVDAE